MLKYTIPSTDALISVIGAWLQFYVHLQKNLIPLRVPIVKINEIDCK